MISIEYFLLYCVVILVLGLGLGFIADRIRRKHHRAPDDESSTPGKLVIQFEEIGTDIVDHWEKVRSFGEFLTAAADSAVGSKEFNELEASLTDVNKVNRGFVKRTERNVQELSFDSGKSKDVFDNVYDQLENHLDNSKNLQKNLDGCNNTQQAISEIDMLLESLDVLLVSKKATEAALTAAQRRFKELGVLLEEATSQARSDSLTQIPNRRSFDERLEALHAVYEEQGTPYSLIMIDLDHLKEANDKYGHAAGDAILVIFARLLLGMVRESTNLARLGGDEFAILMPGRSARDASCFAERLLKRIEQTSVRHKDHEFKLSASLGVAEILSGETGDDLWNRSDKALYLAKKSGRNQYHVSGTEQESVEPPSDSPEQNLVSI